MSDAMRMNRRTAMTWAAGGMAALAAGSGGAAAPAARPADEPFGYCLNGGTIMGQKLTADKEVEVAAKAGYQGFEPWIRSIRAYVEAGGTARDLGKRIADAGLSVEGAIGFFDWVVDDDARRARAMEQARSDMELVAAIGGKRIAAPPAGATGQKVDPMKAAERYAALCEIGKQAGVVPMVEIWGASQTLGRLSEAAMVAMQSGRPEACVLPDVYHMYKGGSPFETLGLLSGRAIALFHVNDYPADPPREKANDSHRVLPGDGTAPLGLVFRTLRDIGYRGMISLELFNRDLWKLEALEAARAGLEKMRAAVKKALA